MICLEGKSMSPLRARHCSFQYHPQDLDLYRVLNTQTEKIGNKQLLHQLILAQVHTVNCRTVKSKDNGVSDKTWLTPQTKGRCSKVSTGKKFWRNSTRLPTRSLFRWTNLTTRPRSGSSSAGGSNTRRGESQAQRGKKFKREYNSGFFFNTGRRKN